MSFVSREGRRASWEIFAALVALRLVNALTVKTFFQPDEYFQSLEPAWVLVFGPDSGAWITWEWKVQLRSSIHPALFASFYYVAARIAALCHVSTPVEADILLATPKVVQALIAASCDFSSWKLARQLYGSRSSVPAAVLAVTVCSPWQWFCSTRTLSNCLETSLTVLALCSWPWARLRMAGRQAEDDQRPINRSKLRRALVIAAVACILRPTNILIWVPLAAFLLYHMTNRERARFSVDAALCGSAVLAASGVMDRLYYGVWTVPSVRFLYFNIAKDLAVFYGTSPWHYYLIQGLPLLLTTAMPFASVRIWRALTEQYPPSSQTSNAAPRFQLALTVIFVSSMLSLVSHKEVRFLYPLLPVLHLFAGEALADFFPSLASKAPARAVAPRRLAVFLLLAVNILIASYTTLVHQSGVISVMDYLRHEFEARQVAGPARQVDMTVGFLMPCHSTPWRSHLVHPGISAWALRCEPPIDVDPAERASYVDEADRFYNDPVSFMQREIQGGPSRATQQADADTDRLAIHWPEYLVFFDQLMPSMNVTMQSGHARAYVECWRRFNSQWHDDWRRQGDVVVWCVR